jgi:hypothetical protein
MMPLQLNVDGTLEEMIESDLALKQCNNAVAIAAKLEKGQREGLCA